jgi:putative addiction module component (TIGR02574 family)
VDTLSELTSLSVPEKLQLVEDLWDSIASDQESLPDHPAVIEEIQRRRARFDANPGSGVVWEEIKKRIRAGRV